jgi:hypothetical protein
MVRAVFLAFLALVAPGEATAQDFASRTSLSGCYLDEKAGCQARRAAHNRSIYGVASIEELQRKGLQVRRIFWVNSSNFDAGMLTITRRGGEAPRAVYQLPRSRGRRPIETEIPIKLWQEIRSRWRSVDMVYKRSVEERAEEQLCFHPWLIGFEAAEPASQSGRGIVHHRSTNPCTGSVGPDFALWVDQQVASLIPACARLTDWSHQLSGCASLRGDRDAASEVAVVLDRVLDPGDAEDEKFTEEAFLSPRDLARWRVLFGGDRVAEGYGDEVAGRGPDRVDVKGRLQLVETDGEGVQQAPFTMHWQRGGDGRFRIAGFGTGSFRPLRD